MESEQASARPSISYFTKQPAIQVEQAPHSEHQLN
jgi:hypothetical protein